MTMKYLPKHQATALTPGLQTALAEYRKIRRLAFTPESYIQTKAKRIREYFDAYNLTHAVIGLSGGIDSAVALGLAKVAGVSVLPVMMPGNAHVSNQDVATERAKQLCDEWDIHYIVVNSLEDTVTSMDDALTTLTNMQSSNWARGQLVSNLRATHLYHLATLLTDNDHKALVLGTTNLDEGGYLGYVGKVSDGMVDCQIISDLHKSEVYEVAKVLGVTQDIIDVIPSGDMFDSRTDTDVFGATYEHVELLRYYLNEPDEFESHLTEDDKKQWNAAYRNLESLHQYNKHKYLVGSPAVHLDILPTYIRGGWNPTPWKG